LKRTLESGNKHLAELFEQSINYEKTVFRLREENSVLKHELEYWKAAQYQSEQDAIIATSGRITAFFNELAKKETPLMYGNILFYRAIDVPENIVILNPNLHDQFEKIILKDCSDYLLIDYKLKTLVEKAREAGRS